MKIVLWLLVAFLLFVAWHTSKPLDCLEIVQLNNGGKFYCLQPVSREDVPAYHDIKLTQKGDNWSE